MGGNSLKNKAALLGGFVFLAFRFLKNNTFANRRIELHDLDFALDSFLIFTTPNNMVGFRRFEPHEAVL